MGSVNQYAIRLSIAYLKPSSRKGGAVTDVLVRKEITGEVYVPAFTSPLEGIRHYRTDRVLPKPDISCATDSGLSQD